MTIAVTSTAFSEGGTIPPKYTCDGADISPQLGIEHVPPGTAELALLVEDPDAPGGTFVHWLAWGLDPAQPNLAEGQPAPIAGTNGFGSQGYRGPCPPGGNVHGHALAQASLTGRYGR